MAGFVAEFFQGSSQRARLMRPALPATANSACLETREEVMFFDTDCGGVVHNLAYLRMIETCRTRLATRVGGEVGLRLGPRVCDSLFIVP